MTHWVVVGGAGNGGILVRSSQATSSSRLSERLATGSLVEEIGLVGERLQFHLITGSGPEEGWVTVKTGGKCLVTRVELSNSAPASLMGNNVAFTGNPSERKQQKRVRFTEACAVDLKFVIDDVDEYEQHDKEQQNEDVEVQKIAKTDVSSLLAKLIDAFSDLDFQVMLQEYILDAREAEGVDQAQVAVPGRGTLVRKALEGFVGVCGFMCGTSMSEIIAPFIGESDISSQLSVMDELLALAPNSSIDYIMLDSADSANGGPAISVLKKTNARDCGRAYASIRQQDIVDHLADREENCGKYRQMMKTRHRIGVVTSRIQSMLA